MFATIARPPEPITLAYRMCVSPREMEMARFMTRQDLKKEIVRSMAHALAKEIAEKCAPFELPQEFYPGQTLVQMEITLHDRGAYEHMLPHARQEGKKLGAEMQRRVDEARTPYGFEPETFYE